MSSCTAALAWLAAFSLLSPALRAQTTTDVGTPPIVVSGFEPFGGRTENASWILAQALAKNFPEVRAVQVPVVWGAPLTAISNVKPLPKVWIAFGEGTAEFQIEILAHNQRGMYPDNKHATPASPEIVSGASSALKQQADVTSLAAALSQAGFPTHVSQNAGRYLCEEMLYSLLHTQAQHPEALRLVLFIHVPMLEHSVPTAGKDGKARGAQRVDAAWLDAFGKKLFHSLRTLGLLPQSAVTK